MLVPATRTLTQKGYLSMACALAVLGAGPGVAGTFDVTSGTSGAITSVPQSYNETRAVDVTVLPGSDLAVTSMTLDGLGIRSAPSAIVGARIYDAVSQNLIAVKDQEIYFAGPVTIPIFATLRSGHSYRLGFFVETSPPSQGNAFLFDPDPPGLGGFPYVEDSGLLSINLAYESPTDSFPGNWNIFVPLIRIEGTIITRLNVSFVKPAMIISWPASAQSAVLESTSDLSDPNSWVPVTNPRTTIGSTIVVTNLISSASQFFRLR